MIQSVFFRFAVPTFAALVTCPTVGAAEVDIGSHRFSLPDGFEIELVAGPPLVDRPMMADFDEQGRLYVADSAGVNDRVETQLETKPHRIVCLEDTDADGIFDKSTVFADQMMFPEGILYHQGSIYCGAPPTIWKLTDTDGDLVADERVPWFEGEVLTGCANDVHGPYLGPDGWFYWTKGAFAELDLTDSEGKSINDRAAHVFRARPDGSGFESFIRGGMDNPVEVTFTSAGDAIFTTTFYSHPQGGERDALVHAVYGGVYPKVHGVLDGLTRTGDLLPALTHLGPAAPSGLMSYQSNALGDEYRGQLFSTLFNQHRVQRHELVRNGSSYSAKNHDFVVSNNLDFHPTDVMEDADGSLLILDTGGWYKICCPTSQIAKPEVLGGIYRVRRSDHPAVEDPRGVAISWDTSDPLVFLADPRPQVRKRAVDEIVRRGESMVPLLEAFLKTEGSGRVEGLRAMLRIATPGARAAARAILIDSDESSLRQIAAQGLGLQRDAEAVEVLVLTLQTDDPALKRESATSLGRMGDARAVPFLLQSCDLPEPDPMLEHSLIYALIEINHPATTHDGLAHSSPKVKRAALIALDQMEEQSLQTDDILPLLADDDDRLQLTALEIATRRSDWGEALSGLIDSWLASESFSDDQIPHLEKLLRMNDDDTRLADAFAQAHSESARIAVVRAMAYSSEDDSLPDSWTRLLSATLSDGNIESQKRIISVLPNFGKGVSALREALDRVADQEENPIELRLNALQVTVPHRVDLDDSLFALLHGCLAEERPVMVRSQAAHLIAQSPLSESQQLQLLDSLPHAGPMELPNLLKGFSHPANEKLALKSLETLETMEARLHPDMLKDWETHYPEELRERLTTIQDRITPDLEARKARLAELSPLLQGGNIDRGQRLFNDKAACFSCHAIGYQGGTIGPDLTRIGSIRGGLDLLEAIVYPNASFARGYEPVLVTDQSGNAHYGVIRNETSDTLTLANAAGLEESVPRENVRTVEPSDISLMPAGLDQVLAADELADLLAFLQSLK